MKHITQKNDTNICVILCQQLLKRIQVSRSTLWRWERDNADFPKRIKLGPRAVGWRLDEVEVWIASRERVFKPLEGEGGYCDE